MESVNSEPDWIKGEKQNFWLYQFIFELSFDIIKNRRHRLISRWDFVWFERSMCEFLLRATRMANACDDTQHTHIRGNLEVCLQITDYISGQWK